MQNSFTKITFFAGVIVMLRIFDSNSEHAFFYPASHFGHFLEIVSFDMCLILTEHLTYDLLPSRM